MTKQFKVIQRNEILIGDTRWAQLVLQDGKQTAQVMLTEQEAAEFPLFSSPTMTLTPEPPKVKPT